MGSKKHSTCSGTSGGGQVMNRRDCWGMVTLLDSHSPEVASFPGLDLSGCGAPFV